jgi:hypothetical protein
MESIISRLSTSIFGAAFLVVALLALSLALVQASRPTLRPVRVAPRRSPAGARR